MDYSQYITQTFQLRPTTNQQATAYFSDGTYQTITLDRVFTAFSTVEELEYYCANYVNREYSNYSTQMLVAVSFTDNTDAYLVSTTRLDFLEFSCFNIGFSVGAVIDYDLNSTIDDYNQVENYSTVVPYSVFTSINDRGNFYFSLLNGQNTIFDYSNLYFENSSYLVDNRVIRGENVAFNNVYHYIENYDEDNVYFSYGAPYRDLLNSEYYRGYGNGYASGYAEGQNYGYNQGLAASTEPNTQNAFAYITSAFNAVGGILDIEVLPHVNLGLCFSIPLVLVLIMTIFKLVRK